MPDEFDPTEFQASKDAFDPSEFETYKNGFVGFVEKAIEPITSYPETYMGMQREARQQIGHGVEQLTSPQSGWDVAKGAANVGLGGVNYVLSPISAGLRTVVGKPIEEATGIPKEYSEFAAGLAMPGIGLARAPTAAAAVPTTEAIKGAAAAAYHAPEVAALQIRPEALSFFGEEVLAALTRNGFDPLLAPKTFGILEKATRVPEGTPFVTASNIQTLRRMLGRAAETPDKTERAVAKIAQRKLDDFMASLPPHAVISGDAQSAATTLAEARANYAAASRSERLQEAMTKAERQAARAGVGGNWENATRQRITEILNNPAKRRGLSEQETKALDDYVSGTFTRNSLRVATKIMGGDNPLMAAIHAGLAWPTSGVSLAAPLTGYVLKRINNVISEKELTRLDELLRSRSPLAKQTARALGSYAQSGARMSLDPSVQNATRFAVAAQFLNNTLKQGAINANPRHLIEPFAAEEERASGGRVPAWHMARKGQAKKISHEAAHYTFRAKGSESCAKCSMFYDAAHGGPACSLVKSPISPKGWCKHFDAKQIERANGGRVDPRNIDPEPTEAQKEAGNYAKDHVCIHGMDITIENAKGGERRGVDRNGKPWSVNMPAHYGYIKGTVGKDKDHVDVYVGPHIKSNTVWVVDQVDADSKKFDEHKAFVGFTSKAQVVRTYRAAFSDGKADARMGHLAEMSIEDFKRWVKGPHTMKPIERMVA